jgi:hypothetical protein
VSTERKNGGVLLTLLVLALVASIDSRLIPPYLDHYTMVTVMKKMFQENDFAHQHDVKIHETMRNGLKINNIRKFDLEEHLKIARGKGGAELVLDDEVRIDLFANLGLIAAFENKVPLRD